MAVILSVTFLLLAVVGRVALHVYQTGNHGIRLANPTAEPIAALAGTAFILSFAFSLLIIALDFTQFWPIGRWETGYIPMITTPIGLFGIGIVVVAQWQMRDAWRIGVDPNERTQLITEGLFSKSRNPIYFGIFLYWIGIAGTLPHPIVWSLAIICWVSIETIVRTVEEPFLKALHGADYECYAAQTNRYLIL